MKYIALFGMMLLLLANEGFAQQMRDYSLSPEETIRQPNVTKPPLNSIPALGAPPMSRDDLRVPSDIDNTNLGQRFMDGYCDPSFRPGIANPALKTCLEDTRSQACELFKRLPATAQSMLDESISCQYAASEGPDGKNQCATYDTARLQLLKNMWKEQDAAYAVVFLPDMVLNGADYCGKTARMR